ncbi:MAG: pyridoxal phosphate-dependent aminotransferase family protein [Verrucomicrobia bacterium]|nr:pyridoxal phosphate-dependent aminotransferase family protein [Verrucomicrobiota bacterium]
MPDSPPAASTPSPSRVFDTATGPEVGIDGRRYLHFGGTGYLDLQRRPELADAAERALRRYGLHPATTRLGFGESPPLLEAEAEAARFFGTEAAWLLPSGWLGASVLLDAHAGPADRLYLDQDAHFALRDAARLSGRPVVTFGHADPASLQSELRATLRAGEQPVVLTDGVFPVTGHLAPLADYLRILDGFPGARVVVDDAHGFGVLGPHGRGTSELLSPPADRRLLVTGTASKALGGYGGLLTGSTEFIQRLHSASPWFAGSTPLPTPVAAATAAALRLAREEPVLRVRLADNIRQLRHGLRAVGLPVEDLPSPMIPVVLGTGAAMQRLHEALRADGILVPYLPRYAGLGPHGALRLAVFATHEPAHFEQLFAALRRHL